MQEDRGATSPAFGGRARRPRILVADDDPSHLDMVTTTLVRQNFDVVGVSGGTQCLAKLRVERFDLVVMDLFMPGLDGVQLLASVRAIGIDVPVIAMTGGMSGYFKPLANSLIAVGAEVVLRKPFAPPELMVEVRRLLSLQSGHANA